MNIRIATLIMAVGLGCAGLSQRSEGQTQSAEAPPQPDVPKGGEIDATECVQAWMDLTERYQPNAGRDATAPNAHESLVRIFVLVETVEQKVWKAVRSTPPDFMLIYSTYKGKLAADEIDRQRAAAMAILEELDRSEFDALLTELVERARAVRPPLDSPKRVADLEAMGITETQPAGTRHLGATLSELSKVRNLIRINLARMQRAVEAGDWDRSLRCFEQNLALARVVSHEPAHLDRLTAEAVASVALCHMRWHIMERRPTDATLAAISAAMDRQLHFPPPEFYFEGEKLTVLDMIGANFKQRGLKLMVPLKVEQPDEEGKPPEPRKAGKATTRQTLETIVEYYPLVGKEAALARFDRPPLATERRKFEQDRIAERVAILQPLIKSVDMLMTSSDQFQLDVAGTRAMIAVERSQRATGVWPAALSDAVKEVDLQSMFDPWSSKAPVKYLRLDAADAYGRNYLIYSVGVDGEDNQGKELQMAKRVDALNKPKMSGVDFVVNSPRE